MKRLILFASIGLILSSCQSETKVPRDCYTQDEMVQVLVDLNLVQGMLKSNFILDDSASRVAPVLYDQVFERNEADRQKFQRSLDFYLDHPEMLKAINEKVVEELNKLESGIPLE